jgi:hypothetical protein
MTDERKPITEKPIRNEFVGTPVRRGDANGAFDHLCGDDGYIRRKIKGEGYTLVAMRVGNRN